MHHRKGTGGGQGILEDGAAELLRHAEDDGQHDDEAGVEEDREAEQQGGHTQREGGAVGAEAVDQGIGQYLGAPRHLQDPAYHGAEADQQRDRGQGAAETGQHGGDHLVIGDPGGQGRQHADQGQCHEGMYLESHDQHQQHDNGSARYREQIGDIGCVHCSVHKIVLKWF